MLAKLAVTAVTGLVIFLFLLNRIPHVTVRSVGWFSLGKITIKLRSSTIDIGKIWISINFKRNHFEPFRMFHLFLQDVAVHQAKDPNAPEKVKKSSSPTIPEHLEFSINIWIYKWLFSRLWMNQLEIHLVRLSLVNESVSKEITAHVDYVRIHSRYDNDTSRYRFSVSVIDGFLSNQESLLAGSKNSIKIFKNVSVVLEVSLTFACAVTEKNKMVVNISDATLSVSVSAPFITPISGLATKKCKDGDEKPKKTYDTSEKIPMLDQIVKTLAVISSVELRVESAKLARHDIVVELSSMLLSLKRIKSYNLHTVAQASAYMNSLRLFSEESKCIDIPSLTYLFECDLSDMFRAYESDDKHKFYLDISTSLDITHPSLDVYFDQLGKIATKTKSSKSKSEHTAEKENKPFLPVPLSKYIRKLRKVSARISVSDIRATLHLPPMGSKEFRRDSVHNLTATATASSFITKYSTKELEKILSLETRPDDQTSALKVFTKLKNFNVDIEENQANASKINLMVAYCLNTHKIKIKVSSRRFEAKSVNSMIFYVVRRLRDDQIKHFNEMCKTMMKGREPSGEIDRSPPEVEYVDLLEIIPDNIAVISVKATEITGTIVCKDGLPSYNLYTESLGEEVDFSQFRRGVSATIKDYNLDFVRKQRHFHSGCKKAEVFVLSEYASLLKSQKRDDYDEAKRDIQFSDLSSIESFEDESTQSDHNASNMRSVLIVRDINVRTDYKSTDKLILTIPEADGKLDMFLIWCVFYAKSLVKQFSPTVKAEFSEAQLQHIKVKKKKVKLDVQVDSVAIKVSLPNEVDTLLEIDTLSVTDASNIPKFHLENCRLYVVHPATEAWTRLICIHRTYATLGDLVEETFVLNSSSVKLYVPFRYMVYTVIDNVITMVKAIKQIKHNFAQLGKNIHEFDRLMPEAKPAIMLPKLRWRSKKFNLSLEDDIFETELGIIFELGQLEQVAREKKWLQFEEEAKAIRARVQEPAAELDRTSTVERKRFLGCRRRDTKKEQTKNSNNFQRNIANTFLHGFGIYSDRSSNDGSTRDDSDAPSTPETSIFTNDDAEAEINLARERLNEEISIAWIRNFNKLRQEKYARARRTKTRVGGVDKISPAMGAKYDIQKSAPGAPIMCVMLDNFDLGLEPALIADIDDFLHLYGKGQPKLDYSILIPLFIRLRASAVLISLKNYPLPVLYYPPAENPDKVIMDLQGNLVINEKLVTRKEEMRHIYVPFTAATMKQSHADNFYSVYVPRTLTPVKAMFDLSCSVDTDKACILNWSKSYQAGFSSAGGALDHFTKPQIDDSPIGWWDKLALIAHGKLRFDFSNELCLHMKSSPNPYKIVGKDAGFMWCWKNGVELKINYSGDQKELVMLDSYDFVFGVPDCSYAAGLPWSSLESSEANRNKDELDGGLFRKTVMSFSSDEKVTWRLGLLFERNVDVKCHDVSADHKRTDKFIPHYDVVVTNPEFEWHPDSYEGYRADYLHWAIGVTSVSQRGNSVNNAYLTPIAFQYFFHWWDTISHTTALPVRSGKLFPAPANKAHVKMGIHMVTFKYQLILEPLTVSHLYTTYENSDEGPHVIITGLKGKASKCHIDLHQRKEVIRYINEKLDIDKKVHHMKLHLGEVSVHDADIRAMKATFKDPSIRGYVIANYTNQLGEGLDVERYYEELAERKKNIRSSNWIHGVECTDEEFAWLDQNDFVELEQSEELSADPTISVLPFFQTPRFTYFREFTLERQDHKYPFGREHSHNCYIGNQSPEQVQEDLLKKRLEKLKGDVDDTKNELEEMHKSDDPNKHQHVERLQRDMVMIEQRFDVFDDFFREHSGADTAIEKEGLNFEEPEEPSDENDETAVHEYNADGQPMQRRNSNALSTYSSRRSIDQANEMTSINSEVSEFHNRFLFHNVRLKWNNDIRKVITSYMFLIGSRRTEKLMMTKQAVDLIESFIRKRQEEAFAKPNTKDDENFKSTFVNSGDVIADFENYLNTLANDDHEMEYRYLIKLISPQFQLECQADPDASMSVMSEDIEMRVLSEQVAGTDDIISDSNNGEVYAVEAKHGVLFKNMQAFVFYKEKFPEASISPYGDISRTPKWPPWIDFELLLDPTWLKKDLVLEKTSMALMVKKPNLLSMDHNAKLNADEMTVHLAKVVVTATSKQYSSMYYILLNLLLDGKSAKEQIHQRFDNIIEFSSLDDTEGLAERVKLLQDNINICRHTLLAVADKKLTPEERKSKAHVELALDRSYVQLAMITFSLKSASSERKGNRGIQKYWNINADQVIWHLVQNSGEPLVDLAFAPSTFQRIDMVDGSNSNLAEISMMQGFNLRRNAAYADLLSPLMKDFNDKEPIVRMKWKMLNRVGGIRIMRNALLKCQSSSIQLDYESAQMLLAYLFPKDDKTNNGSAKHKSSPFPRNSGEGYESSDLESVASSGQQSKHEQHSMNAIRKMIAKKAGSGSPSRSSTSSSLSNNRRSMMDDNSSENASTHTSLDIPSLNSDTRVALGLRAKQGSGDGVDDLTMIMARSAKFFVIDEIELTSITLRISFKAPKHLNIIDAHKLMLKIPTLQFKNKTWSAEDFVMHLKKEVIKIVLSHSGRIIGNKFKYRNRRVNKEPLKQITDYTRYISIHEVEGTTFEEGSSSSEETEDSSVAAPPVEDQVSPRHSFISPRHTAHPHTNIKDRIKSTLKSAVQ